MQERTFPPDQQQSGTGFLLVLAAYFLLQIVVRIAIPASLDLDEAEQVLFYQHLQLGYGTQPPLYSWLQWLMFSTFGVNLFALSALKNLLLFLTYLAMFQVARPLIGVTGAMAASASMLLFPQIAWESQRDLTHSVLLTCLACATLWCYFALLRRPNVIRYALFGVLIALGIQSKYNFAIFVAGLVGASLLVPEHRQILWNRKVLISMAAAVICLLPHGLWLLGHFSDATSSTLEKMNGNEAGYLRKMGHGFSSLLKGAISFITPLWLIYGVFYWRHRKQGAVASGNPHARFFIWFYVVSFACIALMILSGKLGDVRGRWMQPLLFSLPLAFFVVFPGMAQVSVFRRILQIAAVLGVIVLTGLALRVYLAPTLGNNTRVPYAQLASELNQRFPQVRTLIAGHRPDGGNLYLYPPARHTLLLEDVLKKPAQLEGEILLIVRGGTEKDWLGRFQAAYPNCTVQQQGRLDLPNPYGKEKTISFEYALVVARSK